MLSRFRSHAIILLALALLCTFTAHAQTTQEDEDDPVKIFQQGQDAHEAGDLNRAVELYERAIKLHPEFLEALYQRANALASLNRTTDAEKGFRRVIELQPDWSLPHAALAKLLLRLERASEAEQLLAKAVELDAKNIVALIALADLRLRAKAPREKLQALLADLKRATEGEQSNASLWAARGSVELALDDKSAAASFDRALLLDRQNIPALTERAQMRAAQGDFEGAIADALEARRASRSSLNSSLLLARIYARAGKADEAAKVLDELSEESKRLPEVAELRSSLQKDCNNSTTEERIALEEQLKREPRDASLLACLGAAVRTSDPARSLELYRQAAEVEPRNVRFATGYAAALVQARRFGEAVVILRRIIALQPHNFTAHSNLATALYELKQYPEAVAEFKWLLGVKPDLAVAYFFIATAHDFLGEYIDALAAYETFLARADPQKNQLEIDKVNLRLPSLRNQIKRGEGTKKRKS